MIKLFSKEDYDIKKASDMLSFKCIICGNIFYKEKKYYTYYLKHEKKHTFEFCSQKCKGRNELKGVEVKCMNCGSLTYKMNKELKKSKSGNHFCSKTCAVTYNNTHKTKGNRRSKLEIYLEEQLKSLYPDLEIFFNNKDIINSELDIYIPSLRLAFELNGLFHYEPIYGEDKLTQIQNNDNRKFQACLEQGIELCIIDTSQQKYFKEENSKKYLDIIINVINIKLK